MGVMKACFVMQGSHEQGAERKGGGRTWKGRCMKVWRMKESHGKAPCKGENCDGMQVGRDLFLDGSWEVMMSGAGKAEGVGRVNGPDGAKMLHDKQCSTE